MSTFSKSTINFSDKEFVSIIDELPLWSAPFGLKLLDAINLRPNITALDIGFGLGFPLIEMAQRLGNSSKVYGIDPWETAVERAQSKIKMLGLNNIKLISGVAEDIPLPDHSVNLIVSNNGINNVQNLEKVMSECRRIAKTTAQLVATVNLDGTMVEFYNELEKVLTIKGLNESIVKLKKHIYEKRKPVSELLQMFELNEFKIKNVQHDSFKYRYVDASAMFNHSFIKMAFMDSWLDIVPQERVEEIFNNVESRLNEKAKADGEMILTVPFVLIDAKKYNSTSH